MQKEESENLFEGVPIVAISPQGIYKYILIEALHHGMIVGRFVRGDKKHEYHLENFRSFNSEIKKKGFTVKKPNLESGLFQASKGEEIFDFRCRGGGRIEHNYNGKKCNIYGYSQSYGHVDHSIAQKLISQSLGYPLNEITTSPDGY